MRPQHRERGRTRYCKVGLTVFNDGFLQHFGEFGTNISAQAMVSETRTLTAARLGKEYGNEIHVRCGRYDGVLVDDTQTLCTANKVCRGTGQE